MSPENNFHGKFHMKLSKKKDTITKENYRKDFDKDFAICMTMTKEMSQY